MANSHLSGLLAAVFSPLHKDGSLNLQRVKPVVAQLLADGVAGLYVCGSTGEGPSLTREERMAVTEAFIEAAAGRIPVVVQVGHTSLQEARLLAQHAQQSGASAISAVPPWYFKPGSLQLLVACLAEIAEAAPGLPFYYYHIPRMTAVEIDVVKLLETVSDTVPSFAGIKYSTTTIYELQACGSVGDGRFNLLFGSDEMLLSGLIGGAHGAVGSTYNFAAPLYVRIIESFHRGNIKAAQRLQAHAVQMVRVLQEFDANPAIKAMMKLVGQDCGGTRLPQRALDASEVDLLKTKMASIGFFDWARP